MIVKQRYTWTNTIKKHQAQPVKYFIPETLDDIRSVIREAEQKNFRVRAVGAGHSFSDIAITNGYMVDMSMFKKVTLIDKKNMKQQFAGAHLVEVLAGTSIREFNDGLDSFNLAVVNMGGIDHQTVSGAVSTGTHGSGIGLPALSGMVRSMVLVSAGGETYRIEPAGGITDPAKFSLPGVKLIQDDAVFNSTVVGLGCMGIVYSYIMEVRPQYWMEETKMLSKWSVVKKQLADKSIFADNRGILLQINPYETNGDHSCLIVKHKEIPEPDRRSLTESTRNITSSIFGTLPPVLWGQLSLIALFPKRSPKFIDAALKSQQDKVFRNRARNVLYQGFEYFKERAYDSEFAFRFDDGGYIQVMEMLFNKAKELADSGRLYQHAPLGVRFVKKSDFYVTPEQGMDVCYIDTPFLLHTKGPDEILDHYQDVMLAAGGRPHWGKTNNRMDGKADQIKKLYPKFSEWEKVFRTFNPKGIFSNNFSDRLEIATGDAVPVAV